MLSPEVSHNNTEEFNFAEQLGDLQENILQNEDEKEKEGSGKEGKESRIAVHGMIQIGTSIVPDFADMLSDKGSMLMCVDASDKKSGLGVTIARLDDFHKDPNFPASQATVINGHWGKTFGEDGRASVAVEAKYTLIDNLPEANGFSPDIVGAYSTKDGWTFEGVYSHGFNKGKDMNAVRLGVTKKINDALELTAQGRYKSDYDKKFFGRVIMNVDIGNGLGAQLSCVARDGRLTPTAGVIYKF